MVLEGEMGDKFYIILQGIVSVFKGVKSEIGSIILVSLLKLILQRRVVDLNAGDSFGELALE